MDRDEIREARPCGKPIATDEDWERFNDGEGEHLCWCGPDDCDQGFSWNDRGPELLADNDRLRAVLSVARDQVRWLVDHVAEDWVPEAEESVRADLALIDAALLGDGGAA